MQERLVLENFAVAVFTTNTSLPNPSFFLLIPHLTPSLKAPSVSFVSLVVPIEKLEGGTAWVIYCVANTTMPSSAGSMRCCEPRRALHQLRGFLYRMQDPNSKAEEEPD
jgi:hypothetical protein